MALRACGMVSSEVTRPVVGGRGAGGAVVEKEAIHAEAGGWLVRGEVLEGVGDGGGVVGKGAFVAAVSLAVGVHGFGVFGEGDDGVVAVGHADLGCGDGGVWRLPPAGPRGGGGGERRQQACRSNALGVARGGVDETGLPREAEGGGGVGGRAGGLKYESEGGGEG